MPTPPLEPETIDVAPATRVYFETLESLGLLQGSTGNQIVHSDVQELLTAIHHVLAGGAVSVQIESQGTGSLVDDLNTMLQDALNESNELGSGPFRVYF